MTQSEIQAIIDRGGFLVSMSATDASTLHEIHYSNVFIKYGNLYFGLSKFTEDNVEMMGGFYPIEQYPLREATPEEVEKYVPKKYRNTNTIFAQKAIAKANSAQANNSMDKASHIKKIREYLLFQKHPQTANTIATMTGLDYHAVNRRVGEMVSANMI